MCNWIGINGRGQIVFIHGQTARKALTEPMRDLGLVDDICLTFDIHRMAQVEGRCYGECVPVPHKHRCPECEQWEWCTEPRSCTRYEIEPVICHPCWSDKRRSPFRECPDCLEMVDEASFALCRTGRRNYRNNCWFAFFKRQEEERKVREAR